MATGLSHTAFIRLNMILLILLSWNFYHKVLTNFVEDYFCIHWKTLPLAFIYIHNILTDSYAEPHLHPYNKTNVSWLPLWCCICFTEEKWSMVLLLCFCLFQFVCLDNASFVEGLGIPPFLSSLWNSLKSLCDGWSWLSTWQTWEEGTSTEEFPPSHWPVSRLLTGVGVPSLLWTLPALGREVWTV